MRKNMLYTEKFLKDRKYLLENDGYVDTWGKIKTDVRDELPVIELPSVQLLAGFAGYLKFQCPSEVFFRGEGAWYETTPPSLFRGVNNPSDIDKRKKAFNKLCQKVQKFKQKRFQQRDVGALLQHYGIYTDWLDLVDNIFVALWFAKNNSSSGFMYIKFFSMANNKTYSQCPNMAKLRKKDMRKEYSSLSLRPHCQHGISVTRKEAWNSKNIDFNSHLIAVVKLPNNAENKLTGSVFTPDFMFPRAELDNTYKVLKRKEKGKKRGRIDELIEEISSPKILGELKSTH